MAASQFGPDKRPLLRAIHALFQGESDAGSVQSLIDAATEANPHSSYDLYGNFYLGLYHDAAGDAGGAVAALSRAARAGKDRREEDVMCAFPRLHLALREGELFSGGG